MFLIVLSATIFLGSLITLDRVKKTGKKWHRRFYFLLWRLESVQNQIYLQKLFPPLDLKCTGLPEAPSSADPDPSAPKGPVAVSVRGDPVGRCLGLAAQGGTGEQAHSCQLAKVRMVDQVRLIRHFVGFTSFAMKEKTIGYGLFKNRTN